MPELTLTDLSALFAWIVNAQEFVPLNEAAKPAVDKLIAYQQVLKQIDTSWDDTQAPEPSRSA